MKFGIYLLGMGLLLGSSSVALALSDENRPEYQKEYDAYLRDLEVIARTGKAPVNSDLDADLAKMNSNNKIMLTAPQKRASDELLFVQNNDAQIMSSVEVIRVPEEFRDEYHEVYKEEKKTISTQSFVEADQKLKKTIAENPKVIDIADHVNPFRFLAEVPLSPLKKEKAVATGAVNPLVGAYFNQYGRPYVEESEKGQQNKNTSSNAKKPAALGGLGIRNSMIVD